MPNYLSKETAFHRKDLERYSEKVLAAIAEEVGADIAGLSKEDAIDLIVKTECAKEGRLPPKMKHDAGVIAARKTELQAFKPEHLRVFAIKRKIVPVDQTDAELIDAILAVEFEAA